MGRSVLGSLMRLKFSCWPELQSSQGLTGTIEYASMPTHMVVGRPQFLTDCWVRVPLHRAAQNMAACFFQSEWSKRKESKKLPKAEATIFYNLVLKVSYHHFCCMLLVTQTSSGTVWAGTTQECEYQEVGSLRVILNAG